MSALSQLAERKDFRARRVHKYGYMVPPDGAEILADVSGPGEITHIWLIVDCDVDHFLRKFLVRMYWDGEAQPSVEVPLGDLFGVGHARNTPYECATMNVISSHDHPHSPSGHGFVGNLYFPMPFATGARIELVADGIPVPAPKYAFYFELDYRELSQQPSPLRFHAQWRRENPTAGLPGNREDCPDENYVLLEATGTGHYVGCNLSIHSLAEGWWCEGSEMIFVDGEPHPPAVSGIGTEDYAGHGWGVQNQANAYGGCSVFDDAFNPPERWESRWTVYRHHVLDPIPFETSIRVTIEHGHANSRSDDYSSTAYWYQEEPHGAFPARPPVAARLPRPG